METFAFRVRLALNSIIQVVEHFYSDLIRIFIIISKERSAVKNGLAHHFRTDKIVCHRFQHFIHREAFVFIDMLLQGRQAVGNSTQPGTLYISGVIAGATVIVVAPFGNAIVDKQRQECCRGIFGKHPVDIIAYTHLHIHEIMDLFHKGSV